MPTTNTSKSSKRCRYLLYVLAIFALSGTKVTYAAAEAGDCTQNRASQLNDSVSYNCNGNGSGRACKMDTSCSDLAANRDKFISCGAARDAINKECFQGGNKNHKDMSDDAYGAANNCVKAFKDPEHKPPV